MVDMMLSLKHGLITFSAISHTLRIMLRNILSKKTYFIVEVTHIQKNGLSFIRLAPPNAGLKKLKDMSPILGWRKYHLRNVCPCS